MAVGNTGNVKLPSIYISWSVPSATVAVGETTNVSYTSAYSADPVKEDLESLLNGLATVEIDATNDVVTFTGVSAGTVNLANDSPVGPSIYSDPFSLTVTAPVEDESYLNKRGLTHFWENIDDIKQDKLTAGTGISISNNVISATGGGTADAVDWGHITGSMSNQTDLTTALAAKANSADLATVATSGDYDDLTDKPTIGNATLTIQKNGTSAGTFTANATSNKTINITVPTTAADVSALPASTKYGASISVSINTTDYKVTTALKDQDGNTLGTAQVIDLPLESVVVNGSYDSTNKKIILTLQNGNTIDIPVADLVAGLQSEITSTNKLASDLVDDTNQTHKFVTSAQITKLNGIATGAEVNVQSDWSVSDSSSDAFIKNKPTNVSDFTNDAGYITSYTDNKVQQILTNATTTAQTYYPVASTTSSTNTDSVAKFTPLRYSQYTTDSFYGYGELILGNQGGYSYYEGRLSLVSKESGGGKTTFLPAEISGTDQLLYAPHSVDSLGGRIVANSSKSSATGSSTNPVYADAYGILHATTYALNKTVPSDAVFTDTTYSNATTSASGLMSASDKTKLNGIATGAEVNVQSDWNQTTATADDYIKNKPTIPTAVSDLSDAGDYATKLYVQSRAENLVTNGSGLLQDNYNFSSFTFDPLVANGTPGSFRRDVLNSIVKNDELIPVDITKDYMFSFDIRTTNGSARFYDTIFSYDVDGNQIMYYNVNWLSGTTTTLSQKLSPGDTVVHLTSLSGWNTTTTYSYQKGFIFWNYVNSLGYAWGPETYSRNMYRNLYTDNSAVNKTANTITLDSAWTGPEIPAGTSVSQCTDGNNYIYIGTTNYTVTAGTWVHRESILTKNLYRIGTTFVGVGWLANRDVTGTISTWFNNIKFYKYTSIPTVNNGQLTIQKNGSSVATFTANQSGNATANITVPTQTSELTNNSGFLTASTLPIVTSISSSSTDSQVPSAKCMYTTIGNVESILNTLNIGAGV